MYVIVGAGLSGLVLACEFESHGNCEYTIFEKGYERFKRKKIRHGDDIYRGEYYSEGLGGSVNIWGGVITVYDSHDFEDKKDFDLLSPHFSKSLDLLGIPKNIQENLFNDSSISYVPRTKETPIEMLVRFYGINTVSKVKKNIKYGANVYFDKFGQLMCDHLGDRQMLHFDKCFICCGPINNPQLLSQLKCKELIFSDTFFNKVESLAKPVIFQKPPAYAQPPYNSQFGRAKIIPVRGGVMASFITSLKIYRYSPSFRMILSLFAVLLNEVMSIIMPNKNKISYGAPLIREPTRYVDDCFSACHSGNDENTINKTHPGLHFAGIEGHPEIVDDLSRHDIVMISPLLTSYSGAHTTTMLSVSLALCEASKCLNFEKE